MTSRAVQYLRDYVAIPSINPMGREDLAASVTGERRYAEHLCEQLRRLRLDAQVIGDGDRASVVARAETRDPIDSILIASHLDTVPVDGMEIPPFDPEIADDRLFGRGSCDTKGGMASLVAALERVLQRGTLRRNLTLVGEADEELGSRGVADVLAHLGADRPDWVLATEPTELRVANCHKGIALARIATHGVSCHSSDPDAGRNAVGDLARVILACEELNRRLAERPDPVLGPATLSVNLAGGGHAPNIVPDHAWLQLDRRLLPGESTEDVQHELERALREHGLEHARVEECRTEKGPLATPPGHPSVRACQSALRACGRPDDPAAAAFSTDAGVLADHGIPGVVMGPGSILRAHTAAEFVEIDQVDAMTEFFVALLEGD